MTDQANATSAMERVRAEQMKAQVAKVLGQREELTKARLLQDEIKMWQDQYQEASQRAGEQKELSNLASTSVSPVGTTVAPTRPVFPNLSLILVGATALGLALGVLLALFSEMLGRRVRMASDVTTIVAGATFATIPLVRFPRGRRPQSATRDRTLRDRRAAAKRPRTKSGGKVAQQ
jgi:capsular polysaccharide biosynthesis protein